MSEQLVLDLPQRVALGRDAFLVADSNLQAIALIDAFCDWQHPVQWLYGPAGCGKSHLAAVLAHQVEAVFIQASNLHDDPQVAKILARDVSCDVVIIDGLDGLASAAEEVLFHLMNNAGHGGAAILLLSQQPAACLPIALPDLASRLKAVPSVAVGRADDALAADLLRKLFADRQVIPDPRVIDFLLLRIERDYAAMGRVVEAIDKAALAQKRAITVPFVTTLLERHSFVTDDD